MSLRKDTRLEGTKRIHVWVNPALEFRAEASKQDGQWTAQIWECTLTAEGYQTIVDWVMDNHRLSEAAEKLLLAPAAATLAANDGKDWEDLSDDESSGYIDNARMAAREQRELQ